MVSLLEARGVVFDYPGPVRALDGIDFAVRAGELIAVLGPNGSGKSTLVKALAGFVRPSAGSVLLSGDDAARLGTRERARRVAVVPQGLPHLPAVVVRDFVLGGRYAHFGFWRTATHRDRDAALHALERVDASDCADRLLADMSGGQRQRVLIARALAQQAGALLFDEPTASLDPEHQILVMELIRYLVAQGCGAVVVTHDFNLASQFADRIELLDRGRRVAGGAPEALLTPAALRPVYGDRLYFGRLPGDAAPPLVVAWRG